MLVGSRIAGPQPCYVHKELDTCLSLQHKAKENNMPW